MGATSVVIGAPGGDDEIRVLAARVAAGRFVAPSGDPVVCDVATIVTPDCGTVDALAGLALAVRRAGGRLQLRDAPPALLELLTLCGLRGALPCEEGSGVEVVGKPEEGEELLGVEEERDARDPAVG